MSVQPAAPVRDLASSASALGRAIEDFLADHPLAAVFEDGRLLFDLRLAQASVSADHGRCLFHLWSSERNLVRSVSAIQPRRDTLRLETRRFGQTKPQILTLVPTPETRTPTARDTARRRYLRTLEQALATQFPGWTPASFRSAMDLEHSFGPAYARGLLIRGQGSWAVLGVGPEEPPATIEGALTLGILWLAHSREHSSGRPIFHGLKLIVPTGSAAVARSRMAWLNPSLAQWELYELHPSTAELTPCAVAIDGNVDIQLPHTFDPQAALDRAAVAVAHLRSLLPSGLLTASEIRPRSATDVSFSLHGLEYARIRHTLIPGSFRHQDQIFFGAGPSETLLDDTTQDLFLDLMDQLLQGRHPEASAKDPLFRRQPERWLESVLRRDLSVLGSEFTSQTVYSQLFSLTSSSRSLLDLLTVTRQGRLAILEIKADDDLHLPLQALDYWSRIRSLHRSGEIARRGYFPDWQKAGLSLSPDDPLLCLVAPSLHIHPANETVLRHLAPSVPWQINALDEHWRQNCRVVLRKRAEGSSANANLSFPRPS
ncbi:MAG TPA: hypothetical protein VHX37_17170 [Acidobacteriaceae bacterium]|jgi:hypothetical protein|nr:hypothetical protein [Acidobacteriaceae bacterium]